MAGEATRTLAESEPGEPRVARPPLAAVEQGAYLVAGEIGRGGLGQVLEAWDTRLDRRVAVKRLHSGGREAEARFAREARLTARLQHPGVVPVYEAGQWPNGEPYYAMQFISGRSLRELLDERRSLDDRLALLPSVISVAETMAYAHSMGILHRDLKPSNVLVGAFGETIVIDWGLAKSLGPDEPAQADGEGSDAGNGDPAAAAEGARDRDPGDGHRRPEPPESLTRVGTILGTPAYMPPEQASGQQVDLRADVYALGAILYHLLAGAPPHSPSAPDQGLAAAQQSSPPPLAEREPGVPPDLLAIVEKAMARAVDDRYPSAAQMAEDLRRFQTGQLVRAHHYAWVTLVRRWIRRNVLVVAVSGVALALVLAVGGLALGNVIAARQRAEAAQHLAEDRAKLLETSMREARRKSDALLLSEVSRRLAADPAQALVQLADYPADAAEWPRVQRMAIEAARLGLPGWVAHVGFPGGAAFAPDGGSLAAVTDGSLAVFERRGGARTRSWPLKLDSFERVVDVTWLSGRSVLVALRGGRLLRFDDAPEPHVLDGAEHGALSAIAVAEDRRHAITASADGAVTWYDLETGEARSLYRHRGTASDVCLLGARAISVGRDGVVRASSAAADPGVARDLGAGALSRVVARHVRGGDEIVVATEHGDLLLLDGALQVVRRLRHLESRFVQLEWLAGSDTLIASTNDHVVRAVPLARDEDAVIAPGDAFVQSAAGDWLVAAGAGGGLTLVDPHGAWRRTLKAHDGGITALSMAADGALVTSGADGTLRLWERSHRPVRVFRFDGVGASIDSYPGRDDFAVASDTGQLQLCKPSGECRVDRLPAAATTIVRLGRPQDPIVAADFASGIIHVRSPSLDALRQVVTGGPLADVRVNGAEILALGTEGTLYRIDAMRGDPVHLDLGPACARVTRIRWIGAARALLACGGTLAIVDTATGSLVSSPPIAGAAAGASVNGLGALGDSVVALLDSGEVRRGRETLPLFGCAGRSSRMFEAQDGGAYITDCGTQVRLVAPTRWLASPPLAGPDDRIADFDAAVRHGQVAAGLLDRLVLWNYRDATLKVVGSSMVVYNVEMLEQPDRILAASSPGSIQLWDLSGVAAVPTDPPRLADWIRGLSSHYHFETSSPGAD
jgi:WD40 repeat protein/predicted Ser/Thr protein kinase